MRSASSDANTRASTSASGPSPSLPSPSSPLLSASSTLPPPPSPSPSFVPLSTAAPAVCGGVRALPSTAARVPSQSLGATMPVADWVCIVGDISLCTIFVNICEDLSISIPFSVSIFVYQTFNPGIYAYRRSIAERCARGRRHGSRRLFVRLRGGELVELLLNSCGADGHVPMPSLFVNCLVLPGGWFAKLR